MIPHSIYLMNFMSHSNSFINFDLFRVALIIGTKNNNIDISNGVGKSAIFDAIIWAIFDKSRFRTKEKVIKYGENKCEVIYKFALNTKQYKIIRRLSLKSSTEVFLFSYNGNEWVDISCDTATLTNKKILNIFNRSYDEFVNSVCFKQNDLLNFANSTPSKRKEIVKSFLHIDIWDKYQEKAKEKVKILDNNLKIINAQIDDKKSVKEDLDKSNNCLLDLKAKILEAKNNVKTFHKKLINAQENLGEIKTLIKNKNIESLQKRLEEILIRGKEIVNRKNVIVKELKNNDNIILESNIKIKELNNAIIKNAKNILKIENHDAYDEASKIVNDIIDIEVHLNVFNDKKKSLNSYKDDKLIYNQKISQLKALKPGKQCPTCLQEVNNLEDVSKNKEKLIKKIEENIDENNKILKNLEKDINEMKRKIQQADNSAVEINKIKLSIENYQNKIKSSESNKNYLNVEIKQLINEFNNLKKEKNDLNLDKEKDRIDDLKRAELNIVEIKKQYDMYQNVYTGLNMNYGSLQKHIDNLNEKLDKYKILSKERTKVLADFNIHKHLVKAFGKDGIQAIIIENITEDLRVCTNDILKKICNDPMSVEFITQIQNSKGNWVETFEVKIYLQNAVVDFNELSGGQQVRVSIALRLAFSHILMKRSGNESIEFLLLDEVDQALDKRGVQTLAETIHTLASEFKILIITHNDNMKDHFDHIITINKDDMDNSIVTQ